MTTQYTSILKLALPVQGELSGTWGDVVNDNITSMVEEAVAGRAVINTWTTNSHTLTTADGTTSEARCAMLEFTDTGAALTGAATVVCPSASKLYVCKNDSGQQVTIQTAAGTGVAIPDGETMFVFCDGTNVEQCETNFNSLSFNGYTLNFGGAVTTAGAFTTSGAYALTLTTTGATNVTLPTTGTLATLDGTETLTNKTLTAPTISSPSLTGSISATDLTISGNTTIGDAAADTLTVNGTITSNLIFTDDTYDIGATGATRPRNLYLSGNATIGGTVTLSGGIDVTGALGVDGDFDVNTDKFTVASATGNTAVAGTLGVTGITTATGGLNVDTISEITAAGGVTIDSVLLKDGGATLTGDLTVDTDTLYVDSANDRVGVGTSSPINNLHINSTGSTSVRISGDTGNSSVFGEFSGATDGDSLMRVFGYQGSTFYGTMDIRRRLSNEGQIVHRFRTNSANRDMNIFDGVESVFNEDSQNTDFRVESNDNTHMIFVDAGNNRVGIGDSAPARNFEVNGSGAFASYVYFADSLRIGSASNESPWGDTTGDGNVAIVPANALDGTNSAYYAHSAKNSGYSMFYLNRIAPGAGVADGQSRIFDFYQGGASSARFSINSSGDVGYFMSAGNKFSLIDAGNSKAFDMDGNVGSISINQDGQSDTDFRVETVSNAHAIFVDASDDKVIIGKSSGSQGGFGVFTGSLGGNVVAEFSDQVNATLRFDQPADKTNAIGGNSDHALAFGYHDTTTWAWTTWARFNGTSGTFATLKGAIFNEDSGDYDFRVESDNQANMLLINAGADKVLVNTNLTSTQDVEPSVPAPMSVKNGLFVFRDLSASGNDRDLLNLDSNGGWASAGNVGTYTNLRWSNGASSTMGKIGLRYGSATTETGANSEFAIHSLFNSNYGDSGLVAVFGANQSSKFMGGVTVNENSNDQDFRVESNNYSSCFKVDAGNDTININSTTLQNSSLTIAAKTQGAVANWGQGGYTNLSLSIENTVGKIGQIGFVNRDSAGADMYCGMGAVMNSGSGVGLADLVFFTKASGSNAASTERARFKQTGSINGMFMIGTTQGENLYSATNFTGIGLQGSNQRNTGNGASIQISSKEDEGWSCMYLNRWYSSSQDTRYIQFSYNGATTGSIQRSGTNATVYNTTSDYRLKENVVDLTGGIDRVKQLQPRRFNFIADETNTLIDGFIAHEVDTVVPEAVTGEKDAMKVDEGGNTVIKAQEMDASKLVPLLTAALQEAITKIEDLEARITALENA